MIMCKISYTSSKDINDAIHNSQNMLEKAVESLKGKLDVCGESPMELEKLQKQLRAAEKELSKLRNQLTYSTKVCLLFNRGLSLTQDFSKIYVTVVGYALFQKLEETAADNAKIENEIMVLRQKMQASLKQGLGGSGNVVS